jgi:hypothetical protein
MVALEYGQAGLRRLIYWWAQAVHSAMPTGPFVLGFVDMFSGEAIEPEQIQTDADGQDLVWAFRLLTAVCNDDRAMADSLTTEQVEPERLAARMSAMLHASTLTLIDRAGTHRQMDAELREILGP